MKAIREPQMRRVIAAEFLRDGVAVDVVQAVRAVLADAHQRADPACWAAADSITEALTSPDTITYERRAELYRAATDSGVTEVARMFFSASPSVDLDEEKMLAPERKVLPQGRVLTLGERKSLARTHRRDLILHILRDPHPDVIAVLLDNPHLTEDDAVILAARRPASGAMLEHIAASPRWRVRYRVKRALVKNPYTPLHLSLRLASTLRPNDLREVSEDPSLDAILRQQAQDLLPG